MVVGLPGYIGADPTNQPNPQANTVFDTPGGHHLHPYGAGPPVGHIYQLSTNYDTRWAPTSYKWSDMGPPLSMAEDIYIYMGKWGHNPYKWS